MTVLGTVLLVCSSRPRPAVHTGRAGGNQWWRRDTMHVSAGGKTLCGRKCSEWIEIDRQSIAAARSNMHLCVRCASKLP